MRGGEGQPDRAAAAEQLARVGTRLVMTEDAQGGVRRQQRPRAEREVEAGHEHVRALERLGEGHCECTVPTAARRCGGAASAATRWTVARTSRRERSRQYSATSARTADLALRSAHRASAR